MDPLLAYMDVHDLGRVDERISLKGKLALSVRKSAPAELVRTTRGVYAAAALDAHTGVAIDLAARPDARYEVGRLADRIVLGEIVLGIPSGRGDAAKESIALGRLGAGDVAELPRFEEHRYRASLSMMERAYLARRLEPEEELLAWLHTSTELPVESAWVANAAATAVFMLTSERTRLVAISDWGDVREDTLDDNSLRVEGSVGRREIVTATHRFTSTLGNADRWLELSPALGLRHGDRELEVARLLWVHGGDAASRAAARELARRGEGRRHAPSAVVRGMLSVDSGDPLGGVPTKDELEALDAEAPAELWARFELSPEAGLALSRALEKGGSEPWAVRLHARVHRRLRELREDPARLAQADLALAEHLLSVGDAAEATTLLERRIGELPSEALEDLLPSSDADLTRGAGGQVLRIKSYDLLARARGGPEADDPRAIAELARLQPLVVARVERLAERGEPDLAARAREVLSVLAPGGLSAAAETAPRQRPEALGDDRVRRVLRHPVLREGSPFLGKIQALLAAVPIPDQRLLRDFVEQLNTERQPEAARALSDAARLLGMTKVEGYVSRGRKALGVRSYEGPPPFVIIGGRHFDPDEAAYLSEPEMRFALGTEVAHLRYGHSRVTSSEVWAGAWEKSKQGLDFALGVMPLLKGWKLVERVNRFAGKIPTGAIKRALSGAQTIRRELDKTEPQDTATSPETLSALNEQLVAAHRVMQLTADRAGLLLSGSPCAAVRAMLLVRPDTVALCERVEREGIEAVLAERDEHGRMAHQNLAVRVAALMSFYLSDDFVELREAACAP